MRVKVVKEPSVKVDSEYYRDMVLSPRMLCAITNIAGDVLV